MRCVPSIALGLLLVLLAGTRSVEADSKGGPGPGRPIWPKPGQKDTQLYDRAMRIQSGMWWHLSPEGLLAEKHRPHATYAELSHDVLYLHDAAIWTGCYAASQAARWHVTRDPDALAQVRHLAKGLSTLTRVTGIPGCLVRNAGRPLPGKPVPPDTHPSRAMEGLRFKSDASRDQLAGVTLGWWAIARWVDDPEVVAEARAQLRDIAVRLKKHGMWMRDHQGRKTKHGEMRANVEYLGFVRNGPLAAIGLATILTAKDLNPDSQFLKYAVHDLCERQDWDRALSEQHSFLGSMMTNTNVNMVTLALTTLAFSSHGNARHRGRMGMQELRKATVGWWNAGTCACFLLARLVGDERKLLGEIRATLHAMPEEETVPAKVQQWFEREIVPIQHRSIVSGWAWKENVRLFAHPQPGTGPSTKIVHTRADYLFAYWLTRAAGHMQPRVGPGADPRARCAIRYPPWRTAGQR